MLFDGSATVGAIYMVFNSVQGCYPGTFKRYTFLASINMCKYTVECIYAKHFPEWRTLHIYSSYTYGF